MDRDLDRMSATSFDLLVIGGGINGTGVARDAALRGLRVALVEKNDWGWGTSARSTRLIHGGLRYLEQYDFALVHEGLKERELLLRNAPHLVKPLPFLTPVYHGDRHSWLMVKLGMILYDLLSWRKSLPTHRSFGPEETLRLEPTLKPDGLRGGMLYYDGQVDFPERLCMANVVDAVEHGAHAANHARVTGFLREEGRIVGATVEDGLTGRTYSIRARVVVNAAGPWADAVAGLADSGYQPRLRRTEGIHLVVPAFTRHAVVMLAQRDGRVFFAVPWQRHELVGTTDTDFDGDLDRLSASDSDVRYLVEETRRRFPTARLDEIAYTTSGVRALVRQPGARDPSATSRKHLVHRHRTPGSENLISILGGKLTAYRCLAEEVVDRVCDVLGERRPGRTDTTPLPGGEERDVAGLAHRLAERVADRGVAAEAVTHLVRLYGTRAEGLLEEGLRQPELLQPMVPGGKDLWVQVLQSVEHEMARSVDDVLLRRLALGLEPGNGWEAAPEIARRMGDLLGWDEARIRSEVDAYRQTLGLMRARDLGVPHAAMG
ncbi:glycerol-3-phosphate dehydrogenase [Limnochorda pilosa]|uniref:Glycerol-3-phosphate dehydrogenase n=1 Tax=Limnochorda pilosa TaxID=1555112 RepID=A0A0K2SIY9_LIMPI|nr:glycerol-3-phosphate dehydrogenase [Limnochorda pilosa]BAS27068.1 FAD dependent oxidoreductase [Limnochorda pilosa]